LRADLPGRLGPLLCFENYCQIRMIGSARRLA
jgi:hypothetical protein